MIEFEEFFYVSVISNECIQQYHNNTSSSFTNRFYSAIDVSNGEYYVGLLSLSFADSFKPKPIYSLDPQKPSLPVITTRLPPIRPVTTTESTTNQPPGLFNSLLTSIGAPEELDEPRPVIQVKSPPKLNLVKIDKEPLWAYSDYIAVLVRRFKFRDRCEIEEIFDGIQPLPRIRINILNPDYFVQLDSKISEFLGFDNKVEFRYGTNTATKLVKPEAYANIPDVCLSYLGRDEPLIFADFDLPEYDPDDISDYYDQITEQGVVSLEGAGLDVSLSVSPVTHILSVTFNSNPKNLQFSFPKSVNQHLGLPDDYFFKSTIHLKLPAPKPKGIKQAELTEKQIEREKALKNTPANQVFVSTDFTEPVRIGPNFRKVIRSVPRLTAQTGVREYEFRNIQYHKVLPKELPSITITLTDSNFRQLKEELYPTTAQLIFVKSKL